MLKWCFVPKPRILTNFSSHPTAISLTTMTGLRKILAISITLLALIAVGVSAYLTWVTWQSGAVAGCTADSLLDCDEVLGSRWSKWLSLPVSLLGGLTYLMILGLVWPAALRPRSWAVAGLFAWALVAAGAAVWFVGLQIVQLQSFCFYCLIVHGCGLLVAIAASFLFLDASRSDELLPQQALFAGPEAPLVTTEAVGSSSPDLLQLVGALVFSAVGLTTLMAGQFLTDAADTMVMEEIELAPLLEGKGGDDLASSEDLSRGENQAAGTTQSTSALTESADGELDGELDGEGFILAPSNRRLSFPGLAEPLEVTAMPMIGDPQARHVLVEMMDYTCKHCRHLHPHLSASIDRYGNQVAVVIHHVPLSKKCNSNVVQDAPRKKNACAYARLAIGVWKLAPEKFAEFHDWLLATEKPPNISQAKNRAIRLVGTSILTDKKLKAEVTRRLGQQVANLSRIKVGLPVLLHTGGAMRGVPEKSEKLFAYLESKLTGIQPVADIGE